MSDNRRVYRRINSSLRQLYPKRLTGNQARHLNTLTGMITGIVQSKQCHFEAMARKAPDHSKPASRAKRFARYVQNDRIDSVPFLLPGLGCAAKRDICPKRSTWPCLNR